MQQTLCALLIAVTNMATQTSSPSNWVGVWQGELDGIPSVVLTLGEDGGTLQGTIVLNGINHDGGTPHIAVREAHVLLLPSVRGTTLSFEVKRVQGSSAKMDFTVEQTSNASANLHCLNCGNDAPIVEMTKQD